MKPKNILQTSFIHLICILFLSIPGCQTIRNTYKARQQMLKGKNVNISKPDIKKTDSDMSHKQSIVVSKAHELIGKKINESVIVKNRQFKLDCIGTVQAVYYAAGLDISKDFRKYKGNGVSRTYYSLKSNNGLYDDSIPGIGDIIFWDNTWDKNKDKVFGNDPLTHAGLVVNVEEDGTIHYIHASYSKGVCVAYMNLLNPDIYKNIQGKVLNSPLYIASSTRNPPGHDWLSGQLWKKFGGVLKLSDYYQKSSR